MNILLHVCCGPCALYPIHVMKEEGHALQLFYHNPNIHPYTEWLARREGLLAVAAAETVSYIASEEYPPLQDFLRGALDAGDRCAFCYRYRLQATADRAVSGGFNAFSTTLLVSPYQKHELIRAIGEEIAESAGILFYYRDFREGYRWAQEEAKGRGLYRQKYCGCIFSERERYVKTARTEKW